MNETKQLLIDARNEIIDLRRRNELLSAQMSVVDVFAAALGIKRHDRVMAPDVAWMIQEKIDELNSLDNMKVGKHVANSI